MVKLISFTKTTLLNKDMLVEKNNKRCIDILK